MQRTELLSALGKSTEEFGRVCESADLAASVPSCPEWNVADLLWHVTAVHHLWRTVVAEGLTEPTDYVRPLRPTDNELLSTYRAGAEHLLDTLRATPGDTYVWTWSSDHSALFVLRRVAHETAMHLTDAQGAVGPDATAEVPVMDAELACDGIDEFLEHFAAGPGDSPPLGGSVHLHCTDVAGEWLVVDGDDGSLFVTREHAKGDCAIRGQAMQILMALWRRAPLNGPDGPDGLDVIGDADLAARFVARTRLG